MAKESKMPNVRWVPVTLFFAGVVSLFGRFSSSAYLASYADDFFYYLVIAKNIAYSHVSTFDGTHLTNGYHPLWMLVLTAITLLGSDMFVFYALQAVALACFMATYWAARGAFRSYSNDRLATELGAAAVALLMLLLGREGMEVTLTIPLILLLCWYRLRRGFTWTISSAVLYGLLAAMVVLSRLDAVLFVALLFLLECFCNRPISARGWLLRLAALVGGSIPIGLYVLSNRYFFNTLTPISGQAKQLRLHHALSLDPAESLFHYYSSTVILFSGLLAIALAILAVLLHGRRLASKDHLAVVLSLFLFPFLQLLAVSYMSDWPLWSWYSYPFVALTAGALLVGFGCRPASYTYGSPLARRGVFVAAIFAMVAFAFAVGFRTSWQAKTIGYYNYANDLVEFSETHRGVYAMGDAAGTAAYLLHDPFIQLEGLVMDKPYLDNIRQQRDLKQVLASYNVRYYVTPASKLVDGCYQTVEPAQSGPGSPKMRGTFCMTPVARFDHGGHPLAIFDLQAN